MNIKLGSLFDGIGGFPFAGTLLGIEPVWASEIEPFPIRVTEHHFPNMKHLGDITKINGAEIEPVDIITFGSPCQDLSVAGKREGLAGARSGLFMDAVRIIRGMRVATGGQYPRFAVWENVPGAFSSNNGEDFRAVLEEISQAEIPMPASGKWATAGMVRTERVDIAWRTLDAQHWGVPQRRRRIFLVADFAGGCAGEILFVEEGLPWHSEKSREARKETAGDAGNGFKSASSIAAFISGNTGNIGYEEELAPTLKSDAGGNTVPAVVIGFDNQTGQSEGIEVSPAIRSESHGSLPCVLYDMTHADEVMRPVQEGIAPTLNSRMGTGGNQVPVMLAFTQNQRDEVRDLKDKAGALVAEPGMKQQTYICMTGQTGSNGLGIAEEIAYTLNQAQDQAVAVLDVAGLDCRNGKENGDLCGTLQAKPNGGFSYNCIHPVRIGYAVRRLTPLECERLQGFPDNWTNIEGAKDTNRYKAIGNSVAIPCVMFVLGGIARVLKRERTA